MARRRVWVQTVWTLRHVRIVVRYEGAGFDWRHEPDPMDPKNLLREHGRGLLIVSLQVDSLRFNERGNEVIMVKRLSAD